ncbi:MAG TPA: phosphopantothenoylcysteine decarboxylase [Phycisphaerae bacterium]|nr:phosphopantothenoylcysteine decarboxylase [Phycisphaerae bacterium]
MLVTAGPTREFFDSVRFISNPSSGRMGYAIAEAALSRGHEVVLVSGPVAIQPPEGVAFVPVVAAEEMFAAATTAFESCGAAIMTAAVCDYRPSRRLPHKLKKQARSRQITLKPTRDICAHLGRIKGKRVVIGFAMEDHDERLHAEAKLARKQCDAIVLNGIGNVGSQDATVAFVTADGRWSEPITGSKQQVAVHVVQLAERLSRDRSKGR